MHTVDVRLLGPLEVVVDGVPLRLGGRKQRSVLAVLALAGGRVVSVDRLVDGVWGQDAGDRAPATVQVYVSTLRRILADAGADGLLVARRPGYVLDVPDGGTDTARLEARVRAARAAAAVADPATCALELREALALWRGPTLGDLAGEPFAGPEVARYDELRASLLEDRVEADLACGRHADLVPELEAAVAAEPLRERLWGGLMLALYRCGRQADALRAFARARETLADEVGLDPGPALRELEARILGQDPTLSVPGRPRAPVSLPTPPTRLIGRATELATCVAALAADVRLLTLTGPGGVGKTRLALAVAQEVARGGPGRVDVRFVGLDTVTDGDQLLAAVATDLGLGSDAGADPVGALAAALAGRPTLLVLDNCEQVVGVGSVAAELLHQAPDLRLLATSRISLRLRGERELRVPPLATPEVGRPCDPQTLLTLDAVALFVERAVAADPDFVLDAAVAPAVVEVCAALDGLPLAIELAAARVRVLSPAALSARLDGALSVLTGGAQDLPQRQRTLRATLDWSYDLLSPSQQTLLARLGAFRGGFTLEAAEAVCGSDVLDDLAALVDSSLVRARAGQAVRFRLPETVRTYAAEHLDRLPDAPSVRAAHAAQVLETVRRTAPGIDGPDAHRCLTALTDELPNVRSALQWAVESSPEVAARIAAGLRLYWLVSGRLTEGRRWLDRVLDRLGRLPTGTPDRGAASLASGVLAYFQDDLDVARTQLEESLACARTAGDLATEGAALAYTGALLVGDGHLDRALGLAEAALQIGAGGELYEPQVLGLSLAAIVAAVRGDVPRETTLYAQRLELVRARGDGRRVAETLGNLAEIALADGDPARAAQLAEEALVIARGVARIVTRDVLVTLGRVALARSDTATAGADLREALDLSVDLGQGFEIAQCLAGLAAVATDEGDTDRAARLFGAARRMRDQAGVTAVDLEADLEARRTRVLQVTGPDAYDALVSAGASLDRRAVLELATRAGTRAGTPSTAGVTAQPPMR